MAEVFRPGDPSRTLRVGILFDGGSQKSYLTQRVKDSLAIPVDNKQYLSIAAFGSKKGRPKNCEVVHLVVRSGHQQLICDPVMSQAYLTHSSHLSRLELAEVRQEPALSIDLLIGSDFYWEFVTG